MAILMNGAPVAPSFGTITQADFSGVTVHPEFVVKGKKYHNEKGELETGTLTSYGDVGGSDGGATISTGTVNIDMVNALNAAVEVWYSAFEGAQIVQKYIEVAPDQNIPLKNVVTGSIITIKCPNYIMLNNEDNVITSLSGDNCLYCFEVIATADSSQNISFWE